MYLKTEPTLWQGRVDDVEGTLGKRWHQIINIIDLSTEELPDLSPHNCGAVLLGFCCDEGVRRNQGRPGAAAGPDVLRRACAPLAYHFYDNLSCWDGGNIICVKEGLEEAQQELADYLTKIISKGYLPLVFGGGHEVALGNYRGIVNSLKDHIKPVGIINFDAHFDLRELENGQGSSGTPFLQIAHWCQENKRAYQYLCLGIQEHCNTQALFKKANDLDVSYYTTEHIEQMELGELYKHLDTYIHRQEALYLTICLDVFSAAHAPGVSAPNTAGLDLKLAVKLIKYIMRSQKVVSCDIAEMNPLYDIDHRTAKLGAFLTYHILKEWNHAATPGSHRIN